MGLTSLQVTEGTQTKILTDTVGGTEVGVVKVDISPLGAAGTPWNGAGGAVYNTTAPSPANGARVDSQADAYGNTFTNTRDLTATGNITASQAVSLTSLNGISQVSFTVTGTWTGTLTPQVTIDGSTWFTANIVTQLGNSTQQSIGSNDKFIVAVAGFNGFRVLGNTVSSGTAVVAMQASARSNAVIIANNNSFNVNNQGFAQGQFGNADAQSAGLTSSLGMMYPLWYNGSTWDRARGDGTNGAYVQLKNNGTVRDDARAARNIITYGTKIALTSGTQGTIIGSASVGAGTSLWLQDVSIINPYGTVTCILSFGTTQQGTNVLFRGVLGTQTTPGIEKSYKNAVNAGMTNADLVFATDGAGTVDIALSYFISA